MRWLRAASRRHPVPGLLQPWLLLLTLLCQFATADTGIRVAVISDLNGSYGSTHYGHAVDDAVSRIIALKPDLVISTGDMVAGQQRPHLSRERVERMWDAFHARVSDPLQAAGIPLAVTPGNHDASAYAGFRLERRIFAEQWLPRQPAVKFLDGSGYPYHYAFSVGEILFISLDATTLGQLPETQMAWLRDLLKKHGPSHQRRVAFSHLPLWPMARGREREFIGDPGLQVLLEESGVELYLSGHHHAFYPGALAGVAFVGQACLGAGPRRLIGSEHRSSRGFTLLEFVIDGIEVSAYEAPGYRTPVDWTALPAHIRSSAADLQRADLAQAVVIRPGDSTARETKR